MPKRSTADRNGCRGTRSSGNDADITMGSTAGIAASPSVGLRVRCQYDHRFTSRPCRRQYAAGLNPLAPHSVR